MNIKNFSVKYFGDNEVVKSYLKDIRKYKVLTPEEEENAFDKLMHGTENEQKEAKDLIINSNQRFVYSIAKMYAKDEDEVLEYVSEGNIGLITALDEFDMTKGYKFITFAVWYIRRSMNYYLTVTRDLIQQSNSMKIGKKASRIREKYYAENGDLPTNEEIIDLLESEYHIDIKNPDDVANIDICSISDEISDDYNVEDNTEFNEKTCSSMEYENEIEQEAICERANEILASVPDRLRESLKMYFGIDYERNYSYDEIAYKQGRYPKDIKEEIKMAIEYLQDKYNYRKAL